MSTVLTICSCCASIVICLRAPWTLSLLVDPVQFERPGTNSPFADE